jgi:hypothetical protein
MTTADRRGPCAIMQARPEGRLARWICRVDCGSLSGQSVSDEIMDSASEGATAQCVLEQPLVPADSCVLKFRVSHSESAFATASPVSVGRAVSLQHWPPSPRLIRSLAPQRSTFALVTKEPGSSSGSALSAGQPCSTPRKVTNNRPWVSPWAPSPTQVFLHLKIRSMTVADILGSNCRQGQRRTTRTPPRP